MANHLYHLNDTDFNFPPPQYALDNPDGLLAVGGCLSIERLKYAYSAGVFPWFNELEPIMWWSPSERAIIELSDFHVSKSLKKQLRKTPVRVSVNCHFNDVVKACREQRLNAEGTWINSQMLSAYNHAHCAGFAHSVEVCVDDELIGGLYGIQINGVFCGESMFFNKPNSSKLAMWALVNWLKRHNAHFIDCQLENPYLLSLGAKVITREEFLTKLKRAKSFEVPSSMWQPQVLDNIYE